MSAKKRSQPQVEKTLFKLEEVLLEFVDLGFQFGDILGLVFSYLMVHAPGAREEYEDGSHPEYYYGPKEK